MDVSGEGCQSFNDKTRELQKYIRFENASIVNVSAHKKMRPMILLMYLKVQA